MARRPPESVKFLNADGTVSKPWLDFFNANNIDSETDIGSVLSGLRLAEADISVAQATANGASQAAQDAPNNSFVVAISPAVAEIISAGFGPLTTNSVTVTPSGGTAPYTYAWSFVSGDTVTINSPTSATTTFTGDPVGYSVLSSVYRCTVTDNAAADASVTVGISIYRVNPGI